MFAEKGWLCFGKKLRLLFFFLWKWIGSVEGTREGFRGCQDCFDLSLLFVVWYFRAHFNTAIVPCFLLSLPFSPQPPFRGCGNSFENLNEALKAFPSKLCVHVQKMYTKVQGSPGFSNPSGDLNWVWVSEDVSVAICGSKRRHGNNN